MRSRLPLGIGRQIGKLLDELEGERILKEAQISTGQGIAVTRSRLLIGKVGLFGRTAGSVSIPLKAIRGMSWQPDGETILVGIVREESRVTAKLEVLRWPALKPVLQTAASQGEFPFSLDELYEAMDPVAEEAREAVERQKAEEYRIEEFIDASALNVIYGTQDPNAREHGQIHKLEKQGVGYLGGVPAFDDYFKDRASSKGKHLGELDLGVDFYDRGAGMVIRIPTTFSGHDVHFRHSRVVRVVLQERPPLAQAHRGSPVAGAAIGGVLFGAAGAIVGGLSQTGDPDYFGGPVLTFRVQLDDAAPTAIAFSVKPPSVRKVEGYLRNIYGERFERATPEGQLEENERAKPADQDLVSQLERLGELLKAGILTQAEFEVAKARLLA